LTTKSPRLRVAVVGAGIGAAHLKGYQAVPERYACLHHWVVRMNVRASIQRATEEAMVAYQQSQSDPNPLFTSARIHWRSDRIEWAVRLGLGAWLLDEIAADRAFFSPVP